jgi:acetolactate synthase-1/2/3 large subunit
MPPFDRLAEEIAANDAAPVFGVPGSGDTLSLLDALQRRGHPFVLTHFEGAAAIMAGTVGRLSGKAGVALSIKGPGLTNMMPGLAVSAFESFPMVAIVEAYGADTPAAKAHKRIDQAALTRPVSKAITQLAGEGTRYADIAGLAEAEVPGPVVLELARPQPERAGALPPLPPGLNGSDAGALKRLVEKAARPVVIAGALALRRQLSAALNGLRIPLFATAAAKGVIDETLPCAAGVYTGVGLEFAPEHSLMREADLVVCIGMRPNEVLATRPFGVPAVNIASVDEPGMEAFAFAASAGPEAIPDLMDLLAAKSWGADPVAVANERLRRAMRSNAFLPAQVYELIQSHFGGAVRGVFDTGYFCTIAEHAWLAADASSCLMSGQGRYMGTGVPMALAAALYDRSRPTVAFLGDGGIGPFIGEVKLAVEHRLPLLFCLLTDGRFASIRTRALADRLDERPLTPALPSWMGVMEGFGMPAYAAADESGVLAALAAWQPAQGPAYLEIGFAPDPYEAMVKGIR